MRDERTSNDVRPTAELRASTARTLLKDVFGTLPAHAKLRLVSTVVLALLASILLGGAPVFFSMGVDRFAAPEQRTDALLLISMSAAVLAGAKLLAEQRWLVYKPAEILLLNAVRAAYLRHVLSLPIAFHLKRSLGRLDSTLAQGVSGVQYLSGGAFTQATPLLFEIVATIVAMAAILSLELAGIMAVTVTLYLVALIRVTGTVTRQWSVAIAASADAQGQATDAMLNFEGVKTLSVEGTVLGRYEGTLSKAERAYARFYRSLGVSGLGLTAILLIGFGAALLITTRSVIAGDFTLGHLVLMNAYILQLFRPIEAFGCYYRDARQSFTAVVRLIDQLSVRRDVDSATEAMPTVLRRIVVEDVRFSYGDRHPTLAFPSLTIERGKISALLGESGSGKSTLVRLLVKLYRFSGGRIDIDGRPLATINSRSLRERIAVVPQDPVMFDSSLAFNIAMNDAIDPLRLASAISAADLSQLVEKLPRGIHAEIGERGLKLSGGERQRVAIARALYRNAQVLILDEATSALDETTRDRLLETIRKVAPNLATLIITHDPAVAEIADRVTVMERSFDHADEDTLAQPAVPTADVEASPVNSLAAHSIAPIKHLYSPLRCVRN
jgi:ABC-type transport system involved in Fe-S cluster assembly fused permease/ATPase subunit